MILSIFARIETIAASMELRGFGKYKKRTSWYVDQPEHVTMWLFFVVVCLLVLAAVLVYVNGVEGFITLSKSFINILIYT